ncbi:2OG-Fe dioxygenase family protein [Vibrio metschnikovii]|uniref:2OG-Fe dioxygenase family protein n=1 Tax=Vibrio metschnikovii TaxID=28172 RepID=UPI001C2FD89B
MIQLHNVPHYQSSQYNALNGDIERWYKPIANKIVGSSTFGLLIEHAMKIFNLREINHLLDNWLSWYIEVHQFRIIANDNMDGKPTPEGIHKDGVSYIFMLTICKKI